ncbi:MAG: DNA recombination/repair protein RecA, partial [Spirochaetota bacterium]
LDAALKHDLIAKSGSWYSYGEDRIGQGRDNAKQFLEENSDIAIRLESSLRDIMFGHLKAQPTENGEAKDAAGPDDGVEPKSTPKSKAKAPAATSTAADVSIPDDELF